MTEGQAIVGAYLSDEFTTPELADNIDVAIARARAAAWRELLVITPEQHTAMLAAASDIPLERENGGLEYPPFKVFNAMLRAFAATQNISL